jgi:hypothetical protein
MERIVSKRLEIFEKLRIKMAKRVVDLILSLL